jgi:hypothetical protein
MAENDRFSLRISWAALLKVIAMPIAATYPTIEKLWLRDQLGDDVVAEHEAVRRKAS